MRKVYVSVTAEFQKDGSIRPKAIKWENGTLYEIDRVLDIRRAASLKAGGVGMRYTVRINNKATCLFYEEPRWFVEAKES